jgi:hypothetical protein
MYSWNTIRTICAVLLLIPIVHLTYLVSRELLAAMDNSPQAWAGEVEAYVEADQAATLPEEPVVVIGERDVKLWRELEDTLAPRPVLVRGLGGATVNDLAHYHSQLVSFYRPSAVVLLPGSSEFHIRDNKSAEELFRAVRQLVELDLSIAPSRRFFVFAPIKTPLYPQDHDKIERVTDMLEVWADDRPEVVLIDANPLLAKRSGEPNPDYFRMDGIYLNDPGYLRLSLLLREHIMPSGR